jgi:general secretion pathway protein N
MKRTLAYIAGGALMFLVALAALTPATYLTSAVAGRSDGRLRLNDAHGTVWHGDAVLWAGKTEPRKMGTLRWQINPWWLLVGTARATIDVAEPDLTLRATLSMKTHSFGVSDAQAKIPAQLAALFFTPAELLGLDGTLRLQCEMLSVEPDAVSGTFDFWVDKISSRLTPVSPLGSYRLSGTGEGSELRLSLTTVSGDLGLAGQGEWKPGVGTLHFEGAARPLAHAEELEPMLQLLGADRGKGQRALSATLNLPL